MVNMTNLYFIAIVLPGRVGEKVRAVQQYIAGKFESSRSLRVIPHITLKAPFVMDRLMHEKLVSWFAGLEIDVASFEQELNHFGAFENKKSPVIYIKPAATEGLYRLQNEIVTQFEIGFSDQFLSFTDKHFSPHVTVAYRDLKPDQFREAWKEFSQYDFTDKFNVLDFHLLQHDGKQWNIIETYAIG